MNRSSPPERNMKCIKGKYSQQAVMEFKWVGWLKDSQTLSCPLGFPAIKDSIEEVKHIIFSVSFYVI